MTQQALTDFFMWCTIINGAMFALSVVMVIAVPDFVYNMQAKMFRVGRETFDTAVYAFLGLFKIFFIVFNVTPYLALLVLG